MKQIFNEWGTKLYLCERCGEDYWGSKYALQCEAEHTRQDKITRNFNILKQCWGNPGRYGNTLRSYTAIYRLYRELGLTPKEIQERMHVEKIGYPKRFQIQHIIGDVFKFFCETREVCLLRPYLTPLK